MPKPGTTRHLLLIAAILVAGISYLVYLAARKSGPSDDASSPPLISTYNDPEPSPFHEPPGVDSALAVGMPGAIGGGAQPDLRADRLSGARGDVPPDMPAIGRASAASPSLRGATAGLPGAPVAPAAGSARSEALPDWLATQNHAGVFPPSATPVSDPTAPTAGTPSPVATDDEGFVIAPPPPLGPGTASAGSAVITYGSPSPSSPTLPPTGTATPSAAHQPPAMPPAAYTPPTPAYTPPASPTSGRAPWETAQPAPGGYAPPSAPTTAGTASSRPRATPAATDWVTSPSAAPAPSPAPANNEYIVRPGDTLSTIAQRELGREALWTEIYKLNNRKLASPDQLKVGDKLLLPSETPPPASRRDAARAPEAQPRRAAVTDSAWSGADAGSGRARLVRPGDTLRSIAKEEYGDETLANRIREANAKAIQAAGRLQAGMTLVIPPPR